MTGIESILFGLRKLRTGAATVQFDDQVGFGTSTLDRKFVDFVEHLVAHFKPLYLPGIGSPVLRQVLEDEAEYCALYGLPGCVGHIDCCAVHWRCPKERQSQHKDHKTGKTGVSIEAACTTSLYITHFFVAGGCSQNDLDVLYKSPLFLGAVRNASWRMPFDVGNQSFDIPYLCADGIYPNYPWLITGITHPKTAREQHFTTLQEAMRKAVERLFGVMQGRTGILRSGHTISYKSYGFVEKIAEACAIVHNLILDVHGPRGASNAGVQVDTRGRALNLNELMTEFVFEANGQPPTPVPASYTHASHTKHGTCQVLDTAEHARLAAALMNHCQAYNYTDRG